MAVFHLILSILVIGIAHHYYVRTYESESITINGNTDTLAYDYFSLVFQWPKSFCNMGGVTCTSPIPNNFILHGLWPQLNNGQITTCNSAIRLLNYAQLGSSDLDYMKKYWPNLTFRGNNYWRNPNSRGNNYREWLWDHEYQRHGSCYLPFQTQPSLYFRKTVEMAQQIGSVTDKLLHPGRIRPDNHRQYHLGAIENAIFGHLKIIPRLRCNNARGSGIQLYEIEFCFEKNWALSNCSTTFRDFSNSKCGNLLVKFPIAR